MLHGVVALQNKMCTCWAELAEYESNAHTGVTNTDSCPQKCC